MSSLIELEEPYKSRWNKGYLQTHSNGRKYVCLFNTTHDRSLVSYARYLMNVQAGEFLPPDVEADHLDENKTNDAPSNIQQLSGFENKRKNSLNRNGSIRIDIAQKCEECGRDVFSSKKIVTCSRSCNGKRLSRLRLSGEMPKGCSGGNFISLEKQKEIKKLKSEGKSSYYISGVVGVSRNAVMRHW